MAKKDELQPTSSMYAWKGQEIDNQELDAIDSASVTATAPKPQDDIPQESVVLERSTPKPVAPVSKQEQLEDVIEAGSGAVNLVRNAADEKAKDSNPGSLQSKLAASLKYFAPDLVGGLVGGLLGGTEGAAAGMDSGGKLRQQLTDNQFKLAELDLRTEQANRLQKSEDIMDTRTGALVSFNPVTGKYMSQDGKVVPVEFQKNLRVDREKRLQGQGDQRIDISKVNASLRKLGLYDKFDEDTTKKKVDMLKAVEGNKVYQQAEQAIAEGKTVRALVNDAYAKGGQSLAALGTRLAKYMGEVGVLTEEDVTRYVKNPSLVGGMVDTFQKLKSGNISGASKENIERLLDVIGKEQAEKQKSIINKITSRRAKTTSDFDEKEARDIVGSDDLTREDPVTAKRKRLEELRRKARGQ